MDIIISRISFSFSVHATEDYEKNMFALGNLTNNIGNDQALITKSNLEGGYGNPLKLIEVSYTKNATIDKIIKFLFSKITNDDKKLLALEFENRFDRKRSMFFLRFDKEAIFNDEILLTDAANIIKMSIKMRAFNKQADFKKFLIDRKILL